MFATYLRRELRRRMRQTVLVSLGLAVGISLVITITGVSSGLEDAQTTVLESFYGVATDITVTQPPSTANGGAGNPPVGGDSLISRGLGPIGYDTVATIADMPGIAAVTGGLAVTDLQLTGMSPTPDSPGGSPDTAADTISPRMTEVNGVDPAAPEVGPLSSINLVSGRTFSATDATSDVAVVDANYADQQGLAVGSTITLAGTAFDIIGIAATDDRQTLSDTYIPLTRAQGLAGLPNAVNTIYVATDSVLDLAAVRDQISALLPTATVLTAGDVANEITGSLANTAKLANSLGTWLAAAVMISAFLAATVSTVSRRTRELGTLKALSWPSRRILGQLVAEAIAKGVIGAVVGVALGYGATALVTNLAPSLSASIGQVAGSAPATSGTSDTIAVDLTASVTANAVAVAVALALVGALIAGLVGGWRATRLRPAAALARAT